jgi:hypothetical protein
MPEPTSKTPATTAAMSCQDLGVCFFEFDFFGCIFFGRKLGETLYSGKILSFSGSKFRLPRKNGG